MGACSSIHCSRPCLMGDFKQLLVGGLSGMSIFWDGKQRCETIDLDPPGSVTNNFIETLRQRQNGLHFADDLVTCTFFYWKCMNFDFTDDCSLGSNLQYSSIGSDNGLVSTRQQAIIWTNGVLFTDACHWFKELTHTCTETCTCRLIPAHDGMFPWIL